MLYYSHQPYSTGTFINEHYQAIRQKRAEPLEALLESFQGDPQMSVFEDTLHERGKAALERCDAQISWYDRQSHLDGMLSRSFQVATIVLGALTPVLLLGGPSLPVALQALPSALAAIAAGVNGVFHWREDATRYASLREALKSERIKFLTRTTEEYHVALGEHQVLDRFMTRIEGLAMREVSEWHHQDAKPAPSKPHPPVSSE